ncbi:fibronectin type III domain-containing protein [Paenibacillus senegalimassiliensis]|uniref:fibronectin type III domain-containing protein n=1 Tax=Paenibacillus senegalimassiliensis TaxID=1737426 RepID=UPI00073ED8B5|nr:VWA domain-containing protein [Paenibacillus senegalimassiliensis]
MKRLFLVVFCLLLILSTVAVPSPVLAKSSIDIVFIIDKSGSMGPSITAVKNNVSDFANKLAARGISYRLGLVVYNDEVTRYSLTSNVETFKTQVGRITTDGGIENGLDAIMKAGQEYPFDVNAKKYFILIGDEVVTSDLGYTVPSTTQYMRNMQITLTAIGISGIQSQFQQMSNGTGGMYLDLYSDFADSLTKIFEQIQQIPTLEVLSPSSGQVLSDLNTAFIPTVKVTDPDSDRLQLAYYVDAETAPRDTKSITNSRNTQTVSFNALNIGSLSEGQHTMRFTANDGSDTAQDTVTIKVDKSNPVMRTVTVTPTATTVQIKGSATDSVSGLAASPYRYTTGTNVSSWTTATTYTQSNLTPDTTYNIKFEARDAVGHIGATEQTVQTLAALPAIIKNQVTEKSVVLSLQDNNPATTTYQVMSGIDYVGSNGMLTKTPTWITSTNKKITIHGLAANTNYSFKVKARNKSGLETAFGNSLSLTTLASPPTTINAEPEQTAIRLSWPGTPGVSYFDVEADGSIMNVGSTTSYTHGGLLPNTKHSYRVRANNAGGTGNWSQAVTVFTLPDPPGIPDNIKVVPTQTELQISWDSVARADSYDVEMDGRVISAGEQPQFIQGGFLPKTSHTFRIRAQNAGGIGEWSIPINVDTLPYPPTAPDGLTFEAAIHQITIQWGAVEGATMYEVEADGLILDNDNQLSYTDANLLPLSGHTYRVRAVNEGGKSPWSVPLAVTTLPEKPTTPTNVMTTADQTSITVMWYQVPHADNYEVEIDGGPIETVPTTQFVHTDLTSGSTHSYRIRARNVSGYSEWTKPATMNTFPEGEANRSLTNMGAIVTNHAITITWDTVEQKARYEIEVDGVLRDLGSDTIYHHGGLNAEETHAYRIRLKEEDGQGTWVAVLSLSTLPDPPDAPSSLTGFPTTNSIELHWERVEGATGYDLEIDGQTMDLGPLDSYTHQDLQPGTSHMYRLRAKNETGVTAWSLALNASTTSPTYIVDVKRGQSFDLSLLAFNVQDFSEMTFVVKYDTSQLEVTDLYQYTPELDLISSGPIPGSDVEVTYSAGQAAYTIKRNVVPGTSWSGEVCTLTFKSQIDGQASIDVFVE